MKYRGAGVGKTGEASQLTVLRDEAQRPRLSPNGPVHSVHAPLDAPAPSWGEFPAQTRLQGEVPPLHCHHHQPSHSAPASPPEGDYVEVEGVSWIPGQPTCSTVSPRPSTSGSTTEGSDTRRCRTVELSRRLQWPMVRQDSVVHVHHVDSGHTCAEILSHARPPRVPQLRRVTAVIQYSN